MPKIEGIEFDNQSYGIVMNLIERLEHACGDVARYGLPKMQAGRGELRLAHEGPSATRKKAKGVFCRFIPTADGVTHTLHKEVGAAKLRTPITEENRESIFQRILHDREVTKERRLRPERVFAQPNTLSSHFEANRRRH